MTEKTEYDQFLEKIDKIAGLAETFQDYTQQYREALDTYNTDEITEETLENSIDPIYDTLERTFETLEELDQKVEESDMRVPVRKGNKKGVFNLEKWMEENNEDITSGIDSFRDAVTFTYLFDDEKLQVTREGEDKAAATLIDHEAYIVETYEKLDRQFDEIIELEERARDTIETTELGVYDPEPPIYQFLNGEHNEKASGLNNEVRKAST